MGNSGTSFTRSKEEASDIVVLMAGAIPLASIADGNLVTGFPLDFEGEITSMVLFVPLAASTASKGSTLTLKIGSTAVTGCAKALTTANCTQGVIYELTATGAKKFKATDTLALVASSTTTFGEGFLCWNVKGRRKR